MATIEAEHPGVTALHINGCSGDINPLPRRKVELMEEYGDEMAASVASAALAPTASTLAPIAADAPLVCSAVEIPLRYHTLPTREELIRTRDDPNFFAPCMLPTGESDCFPSVLSRTLLSVCPRAGCAGDGSAVCPTARVPQNAGHDPKSADWSESSMVKFDYTQMSAPPNAPQP